MLVQLQNEFPQDVRIVFRHFPLSFHDKAAAAARAAEAAGAQGKFEEMKIYLMGHQAEWSGLTPEEFDAYLNDTVLPAVKLDAKRFVSDYASPEIADRVDAARKQAESIGLPGTPFLVINDRPYQGQLDYGSLSSIVKLFQLQKFQYSDCPARIIDPAKDYTATIKTDKGDIVIDLLADKAPMTVNNFVFLAREGWYDGVAFHRVLPNFVAQAGDPSGTGYGGPGYTFSNEVDPSLRFDKAGVLGMANAGPDSNGSQFFITYVPAPQLDGSYTVFGQVVQGMDVLEKLQVRDPSQPGPLTQPDLIETILIQEK